MSYDSVYSLLSYPQGRRAVAAYIDDFARNHPQDPNLATLNLVRDVLSDGYAFMPMSPDDIALLERVLSVKGAQSFLRAAARFSDEPSGIPIAPEIPFVPRGENDDLGSFVGRNEATFGFGRKGVGLGAARRWGSLHVNHGEETDTSHFIEPRDPIEVLNIYRRLAVLARDDRLYVDIWDVLASVYPPVREMLRDAEATGREIVVRVPNFMQGTNFDQFSYMTFAQAARREGLVSELPGSTVGAHARAEVEHPRWETLGRYADIISERSDGDPAHRKQIFNFLVLLRLMEIVGKSATVMDLADRPLTRPPAGGVSRYTVRVVPENELVEYISFGGTARFSVQRWPFSEMASGRFDRMFEILKSRVRTLDALSYAIDSSHISAGGTAGCLSWLKEEEAKHLKYKANISNPTLSPSLRTLDYLNAVKNFYHELSAAFERILFLTPARGHVDIGGLRIPFEVVVDTESVVVAPMAGGRVSVTADDIVNKSWPERETRDTFELRVFLEWQMASGVLDRSVLDDPQKIVEAARRFPQFAAIQGLEKAASNIAQLNLEARQRRADQIDPTFSRILRMRTTGTRLPSEYYIYSRTPSWQAEMERLYNERGYRPEAYARDVEAAETYFRSVRHPHSIYNASKLDAAIAQAYSDAADREKAKERLLDLFQDLNVRTDPRPVHPLTAEETSPELKAIEWASWAYLSRFPGARELGAKVEIDDHLINEVVDQQIAEHPDIGLRRGVLKLGVKQTIANYNAGRSDSMRDITNAYSELPSKGILTQRFDEFLNEWGVEKYVTEDLDRDKLLAAHTLSMSDGFQIATIDETLTSLGVSDDTIRENIEFFLEWFMRFHRETELLEELTTSQSLLAYFRANFNAPLISFEEISNITRDYLKARLFSSTEIDLDSIIVSHMGGRFDAYPTIKAEAVAFYHLFVGEYLKHLHDELSAKYKSAVSALDQATKDIITGVKGAYRSIDFQDFTKIALAELGLGSPQDRGAFQRQLTLVAQAVGKEGTGTSLEVYATEKYGQVDAHIHEAWTRTLRELDQKKTTVATATATINDFSDRVEAFAAEHSASVYVDGMDLGAVDTALAAVNAGLELAAGFQTELDGKVTEAYMTARQLIDDLGGDSEQINPAQTAEETLSRARHRLLEDKALLEDRQTEIQTQGVRALARQEAEKQAGEFLDGAGMILELVDMARGSFEDISGRITALRDEIKETFEVAASLRPTDQAAYQARWQTLEAYRTKIDELRRELNTLREELKALSAEKGTFSPAQLNQELAQIINSPDVSDETRQALLDIKRMVIRRTSEMNLASEQAEIHMTRLGGLLNDTQQRLEKEEEELPVPDTVDLPAERQTGIDPLRTGHDRWAVSFNTSPFQGISTGRLERRAATAGSIELLVVGDKSYLIGSDATAAIERWRQDRTASLSTSDIFSRTITIETGFRGVRIVGGGAEGLDPSHTLTTLREKISFLFSKKGYEAEFATRLFEEANVDAKAKDLWLEFLGSLAREDASTHHDVTIFVRRFALSHQDEIGKIKALSKNSWFVETDAPLEIALTDAEMAEVRDRPIEKFIQEFAPIAALQDDARVAQNRREIVAEIQPHVSHVTTAWLQKFEMEIPVSVAVAWQTIKEARNASAIKQRFLADFSLYLEERRAAGPQHMSMPETTRFAMYFLMKQLTEIKFGHMLYDENGSLLYTLAKHDELRAAVALRAQHRELRTIVLVDSETGKRLASFFVTPEERERIAANAGTNSRLTISYVKVDKQGTETRHSRELPMGRIAMTDSPMDRFTDLLLAVYSNPRFIALGFMIDNIVPDSFHFSRLYQSLINLFEAHQISGSEPEEEKFARLVRLEKEVHFLFRQAGLSGETAIGVSGATAASTAPAGAPSPAADATPAVEPVLAAARPSASGITGYADPNVVSPTAYAGACATIDGHIARACGEAWTQIDPQFRGNVTRALANMGLMAPGSNQITIGQQAFTMLFSHFGIAAPVMSRPILIANPFFGMNFGPSMIRALR